MVGASFACLGEVTASHERTVAVLLAVLGLVGLATRLAHSPVLAAGALAALAQVRFVRVGHNLWKGEVNWGGWRGQYRPGWGQHVHKGR